MSKWTIDEVSDRIRNADEPTTRKVAVVLVTHDNHLLMGKRRDSGKWALPGGHMEGGESAEQTAMRELYEETGILASHVAFLRSYRLSDEDGKPLNVHIFHTALGSQVEPTFENDPDQEFKKFKWVDFTDGLPEKYQDKLHRDLDLGLTALGLI